MTVCNFFLQGRCRYGDKCWNEHPRGGNRGGGGGHNSYNRSSDRQQPRGGGGGGGGGGGFGNRVWVNPNQQKGGYIQPSSFSSRGSDDWDQRDSGGADWGRGGGGRKDNVKSSDFSFTGSNRYSLLSTPNTFDRGGRRGGTAGDENDDKKLEVIQMDMEIWETSRQWVFSCYSSNKTPLSGFTDLSPEELRLEYYSSRASGDIQGYINGINQLHNKWRNRVQELRVMNPATRAALLTEINNPETQASSSGFGLATATGFGSSATGFGSSATGFGSSATGFGSSTPDFGSKGFGSSAPVQVSEFSFAAPGGGFGSSATSSASTGFGSVPAAPSQPPAGFGSSSAVTSAPSASTFSFAAPTSDKPAATSVFSSASGFSFSSTGGFKSGFGTETPAAAGSSNIFGQISGGTGPSAAPSASGAGPADSLFSSESKLTPEELNQFKAKRFTLGQIPLKPPPADLLIV